MDCKKSTIQINIGNVKINNYLATFTRCIPTIFHYFII